MMKRLILYFLVLAFALPAVAENPEFHRSSAQKGVKTSTDVIAITLPASALVGTLILKDWTGLLQGVETAAATAGVTYLLKYTVKERRPDGSDLHSFPSGHTAVSFASATYLQRRYGWKFGVPAYILSTYVGWGRCFSKKHYWYDVVAGAAIGTGSAFIFTRPWAKEHNLTISPVSDGRSVGIYASFEF